MTSVATPPTTPKGLSAFLTNPRVQEFAARLIARVSRSCGKPLRLGRNVIVARHADVVEALARDMDFVIGPVNAAKIDLVNGPFILGMDRSATLMQERSLLYRALGQVDMQSLQSNIIAEASDRLVPSIETLDVVNGFARPIAAGTATRVFGIDGEGDQALFMDVARALFGHIFLNLSGDKDVEARAVRARPLLEKWFLAEIGKRRVSGNFGTDMMGAMLSLTGIGNTEADDHMVRRNLSGMLVGSIDTTATAVAKIITVLGYDRSLAQAMARDVDDSVKLHGWCWEALRRWPHNPIVLRKAARDTKLANANIKAGDSVYVFVQAAMFDPAVFPLPSQSMPHRPMHSYLHFGGGLHVCAGRDINAFQIPLLVGALVRRGIKSVGPINWAGPFPDRLPIVFDRAKT